MSDLSNLALEHLARRNVEAAVRTASDALRERPDDWHVHYVWGQCLRFSGNLSEAIESLSRAHQMAPQQLPVLLALGIAHQLHGHYDEAINLLQDALLIDPDYVLAINSLAMTHKLMGNFEESSANYELAAKALARTIVKSWSNSARSKRFKAAGSRNNLWAEHALYAALWLVAREASIDSLSWPTADIAERDATTGFLEGWYWKDDLESGKGTRFFCPNFFNTFHDQLVIGQVYKDIVGNRGTVLMALGKVAEANAHFEEAEDFSI